MINVPAGIMALIVKCFHQDPTVRPTFDEIIGTYTLKITKYKKQDKTRQNKRENNLFLSVSLKNVVPGAQSQIELLAVPRPASPKGKAPQQDEVGHTLIESLPIDISPSSSQPREFPYLAQVYFSTDTHSLLHYSHSRPLYLCLTYICRGHGESRHYRKWVPAARGSR